MNDKFQNKVNDTLIKHNMLSFGDKVVVGVSGGADSMALLVSLLNRKNDLNLHIIVAHIEHGIRGQESLDDAEFVKSFCDSNNIEFHQLSINAVEEAKLVDLGVEEYSRKRRYEFFDSFNADKIATAHNLTDNVETVLFRLTRGTGLKGMCGIPPVRDNIIRPLIELTSQQIREYCADNNIKYMIDSTNSSNDYSRNLIRNEILPKLELINSNYQDAINSFIADINEDYCCIEGAVDDAYNVCFDNDKLLVNELKNIDTAIAKRVIKKYFFSYGITLDRLHLQQVAELVNKQSKIQIEGSIYAVSNKKYLRFADLSDTNKEFEIVKKVLNISEFNCKNVDFYCDYDKIIGDIVVRKRMEGDVISPANRNCKKTLKKLFNEYSIPIEERGSVPVICDNVGVIGIVGYCVDERVKLDDSTKNILSVKLPLED